MKSFFTFILLVSSISLSAQVKYLASFKEARYSRIQEIATMLNDSPQGLGKTYHDRDFWMAMRKKADAEEVICRAENILGTPFPRWSDELYLQFSQTALRPPGERMIDDRTDRLAPLVWAECLENTGKYLHDIEMTLKELISHRSWVSPAHDRKLHDFYGRRYSVDLRAAAYAQILAQALYMLDDKLSPEIRKIVYDSLERRVFHPVRLALEEQNLDIAPWIMKTNNWNSVCWSGVIAAAMAVIPDKYERAYFLAAAEYYSQNAMDGYKSDGYCTEGVHYYSYGFGHYIYLREIVFQQTKGQIDLFKYAKVRELAQFPYRMEIINGKYPSYGDCYYDIAPLDIIVWYCDRVFGRESKVHPQWHFGSLSHEIALLFPNEADKSVVAKKSAEATTSRLRSYFKEGGALVVRPYQKDNKTALAAAFKGGNNQEHHNHNDLGSYTIVKGKEVLAGDQGGPMHYNGDMATSRRYEFKLLSSYGHPVPCVNGECQKAGAEAQARVLNTDFQNDKDRWSIDISSAYDVPDLQILTRTFAYDRNRKGEISITDRFVLENPAAFETALTTRCNWEQIGKNLLHIFGKDEEMYVRIIHPKGTEVEIVSETIEVNAPPYSRIGIRLRNKLSQGELKVVFMHDKPQSSAEFE